MRDGRSDPRGHVSRWRCRGWVSILASGTVGSCYHDKECMTMRDSIRRWVRGLDTARLEMVGQYVMAFSLIAVVGLLALLSPVVGAQTSTVDLNITASDVTQMTSTGSDIFHDLWPLMIPFFGLVFGAGLIRVARRARR